MFAHVVFLSSTRNINARVHFIQQKSLHNQVRAGSGAVGRMPVLGDCYRTVGVGTTLGAKVFFMKKIKCHSCHAPLIVIKASFPNCVCHTMNFYTSSMGSPMCYFFF